MLHKKKLIEFHVEKFAKKMTCSVIVRDGKRKSIIEMKSPSKNYYWIIHIGLIRKKQKNYTTRLPR